MNEYWEVKWVQFRPDAEEVIVVGFHVVEPAEGRSVRQSVTVTTTQSALTAACPEGVTVWGDAEVATIVEDATGVECRFMDPQEP